MFAAPLTIIRLHVNRDYTVWVNASTQKSAQNIVGAQTLAGSVNELRMEGKVQVCLWRGDGGGGGGAGRDAGRGTAQMRLRHKRTQRVQAGGEWSVHGRRWRV